MAKKPTAQQRRMAKRARPKARRQRTPEEIAAVRAVRSWRKGQGPASGPGPNVGPRQPGPAFTPEGGGFADMFGDLLTPMSPGQMDAESRRVAMSQANAAMAGVGGASRGLQQAFQQAVSNLNTLSGHASGVAQTVGPGIANVYNQAAATQGGLASGFSGQLRDTVAGQAAQDQAFLANILGAPQGQVDAVNPSAGGDAANVAMGVGGLLPATALGQAGAAFGAYGATLPATIGGVVGQFTGDLFDTMQSNLSELSARRSEIAAGLPAAQAEHRARLEAANLDKIALAQEQFEKDRRFQLELMAAEQAMRALGMDEAKIQEEIRQFEVERQDENARFLAELDYQRERDAAEDAQRAADAAAGRAEDASDARADRAEKLAKMRRARVDLWDAAQVYAKDLRIEVERPKSGEGVLPGLGGETEMETVRIRPGWNRAMNEMRKKYVKEIRQLRRMGVRKSMINKILSDALKRAGYRKPRRPRVRPGDLRPGNVPGP